jgi:hypothetical protein
MAKEYAHLFPIISSITRTTQIYTQRRSSAESPANYRFTVEELMDFISAEFGLLYVHGEYDSDEAAGIAGCDIDQVYELSASNIYGLPEGTLKRRK